MQLILIKSATFTLFCYSNFGENLLLSFPDLKSNEWQVNTWDIPNHFYMVWRLLILMSNELIANNSRAGEQSQDGSRSIKEGKSSRYFLFQWRQNYLSQSCLNLPPYREMCCQRNVFRTFEVTWRGKVCARQFLMTRAGGHVSRVWMHVASLPLLGTRWHLHVIKNLMLPAKTSFVGSLHP